MLHITVLEMHQNNMSTGSGLWNFLYCLVHKFIRMVVSSEKDVATTKFDSAQTGIGRHVIVMHFGNGDEPSCKRASERY